MKPRQGDRPPPRSTVEELSTELDLRASAVSTVAGAVRVYLLVREAERNRVVEIGEGDELLIGRTSEAAVAIDDARVSRQHAVVARRGPALFIRDLGSRNATAVNGRPLRNAERALLAGDVVHVGQAEIVVAAASNAWRSPVRNEAHADLPEDIVIADAVMVELFQTVRRVASAPTTVLIQGETGVGKEIIAEQLHRHSPRARGPFIGLNCASLPETLLESELFGHEKGAFTGAMARKQGYFEAADGGTLLLDEVGELPVAMQAKLLRVLETRRVVRLGATRDKAVDVRIVGATHRDLEAEVAAGRFRQDLYYRLSGFTLRVPPLRERPAEVALLTELFAHDFARRTTAARPPTFSSEAKALLAGYAWPGNVRELKNAVEHAVILADGATISPEHFPAQVRGSTSVPPPAPPSPEDPIRDRVAVLEKRSIEEALAEAGGNRTRAAIKLGVSRGSLMYKMSKYGIGR